MRSLHTPRTDTWTQPTCDKGENALHEGVRLARGILPQSLGWGRGLKAQFPVPPLGTLRPWGRGPLIVRPWGPGHIPPAPMPTQDASISTARGSPTSVPLLFPDKSIPTEAPAPLRSASEVRGPRPRPAFSPGACWPRRRPPGTGPGSPWLAGRGEPAGQSGAGPGGGAGPDGAGRGLRRAGRRAGGGAGRALPRPSSVTLGGEAATPTRAPARAPPSGPGLGRPPHFQALGDIMIS